MRRIASRRRAGVHASGGEAWVGFGPNREGLLGSWRYQFTRGRLVTRTFAALVVLAAVVATGGASANPGRLGSAAHKPHHPRAQVMVAAAAPPVTIPVATTT